jgi:hypothetical protein
MQVAVIGGMDQAYYAQLQAHVSNRFCSSIDEKLKGYDGDIKQAHDLISGFIQGMPNPATENKLLERETMPVRIRFAITDVPVVRIEYSHEQKPYELWVYGNEHKVYASKHPRKLTAKVFGWCVVAIAVTWFVLAHI